MASTQEPANSPGSAPGPATPTASSTPGLQASTLPGDTTPTYLNDVAPVDIGALLRSLLTKDDIRLIISNIEELHRRELQGVRGKISTITTRLDVREAAATLVETRLAQLESGQVTHEAELLGMQLQIEGMEDRSCRNNLRLREIPESDGPEDLMQVVTDIFRSLLDLPDSATLKLDWAHRALGPRSTDPAKPRDVLCRLHYYSQKEEIMRKAWQVGPVTYREATVQILPDLSRSTLCRRTIKRPLLDALRTEGHTYRWAYLFYLVRKELNHLPCIATMTSQSSSPFSRWPQ